MPRTLSAVTVPSPVSCVLPLLCTADPGTQCESKQRLVGDLRAFVLRLSQRLLGLTAVVGITLSVTIQHQRSQS